MSLEWLSTKRAHILLLMTQEHDRDSEDRQVRDGMDGVVCTSNDSTIEHAKE